MKPWPYLICLILVYFLANSARAQILITSFDAFSGGSANNSRLVAQGVVSKLNDKLEIYHCHLTTAFVAATEQIIGCINQLPESPKLIISLGEGGCGKLKLETVARNWAYGRGTDNLGQSRNGEVIIAGAPQRIGLNIDWSKPFCSLDYNSQKSITLASNDAQTFVCNETMYRMSYFHSQIPFGFIHVPAHSCRQRSQKIDESIEIISHLINEFDKMPEINFSPYLTEESALQSQFDRAENECERDFLRRLIISY